MTNKTFTLIEGGKNIKPSIDYESIYLNAMVRAMIEIEDEPVNKCLAKKIIYYGIGYLNMVSIEGKTIEDLERLITLNDVLLDLISELTPIEFMTIFPPEKVYDGEKYQSKDYYSTMQALNEFGLNNAIGTRDAALSLLFDYMNTDVMDYNVKNLIIISAINRMNTGKSLMEEFFEKEEIDVPLYNFYEGDDGKKFLVDKDGRSFAVKKKNPRYMNLVI